MIIGPGAAEGRIIGAGGGAGLTLTTKLGAGPAGRTIGGALPTFVGNWTTIVGGAGPGAMTRGVARGGRARGAATVLAGPNFCFNKGKSAAGGGEGAARGATGADAFKRANSSVKIAGLRISGAGMQGQGAGKQGAGGAKGGRHGSSRPKGGGHSQGFALTWDKKKLNN